ncbi:MAG: FIST C-terminal domain-containing protein, partial [Myxococcales bacterium]|nr:FIST C-terminal domain-containing protein [Myxococcales bacterium]
LQFCGFEVMEDALPLLWLGTDGPVAVGVQSGWNPVGTPGTVTEVDGNVVISIDGEPALGFFQRYFGDQHEPVPQYPLCVEQAGGGLCLRAPMAYDASGRVVFAGDVPAGATVRLSDADRHGILEGSSASVREALQAAHGPALMLAFSCAARKHVLGTRTAEEIDRITALTGALPVAGFYGYGEFLVRNGVATFHNETLITIALGGAA